MLSASTDRCCCLRCLCVAVERVFEPTVTARVVLPTSPPPQGAASASTSPPPTPPPLAVINDAGEALGISAGDDDGGDGASGGLPAWMAALIVVGVLLVLLVLVCIGTVQGVFREVCPSFTAWMQGGPQTPLPSVSAKKAILDVESATPSKDAATPPVLDKNEPDEVSSEGRHFPFRTPHLTYVPSIHPSPASLPSPQVLKALQAQRSASKARATLVDRLGVSSTNLDQLGISSMSLERFASLAEGEGGDVTAEHRAVKQVSGVATQNRHLLATTQYSHAFLPFLTATASLVSFTLPASPGCLIRRCGSMSWPTRQGRARSRRSGKSGGRCGPSLSVTRCCARTCRGQRTVTTSASSPLSSQSADLLHFLRWGDVMHLPPDDARRGRRHKDK